jgi:hypothetical protein
MIAGSKCLMGFFILCFCLPLTAFAHVEESTNFSASVDRYQNGSVILTARPFAQSPAQDHRMDVQSGGWLMARAAMPPRRHSRR